MLTHEQFDEIGNRHIPGPKTKGRCRDCQQQWPCDVALLVAHIARVEILPNGGGVRPIPAPARRNRA